jgi:iron complex outermembrane receptor protein
MAVWRLEAVGARVLALSFVGVAAAADPQTPPAKGLTELSLSELANLDVTSVSKRPEERFQTAAAVYVITGDEIRRSGAKSIPELLRMVPGVDVARVDASQWAVGIRGFTSTLSRAQLVLIDGRSVYSPLFAGTYWDVQDVPLEDVERIEVIRGPGGSLWGANAVDGIINIITRSAKDTTGGVVSAGGGNQERGFGSGRYGGDLGTTGHYRVWGKYFDRAAEFNNAGDGYDAWHLYHGGFRSDWDLPAASTLSVQGALYSGHAGRLTTATSYDLPYLRTIEANDDLSGGYLSSKWTRPLREHSELSVQVYFDRTNRGEPTFTENRDTFDLDGQYQTDLPGRQSLVTGVGYRISRSRASGLPTVAFRPPTRTDNLWSGFVEDTIEAIPGSLKLTLGTKLEHNDYSGFEWQPTGRIGWSVSPSHFLWAAFSRPVRTPSRVDEDLALTGATSATTPVFIRISGNPSFESERTEVIEAGYRFRSSERLLFFATAFRSHSNDLESIEAGAPFLESGREIVPYVFANGIEGTVAGAEITADAQLSSRWLARAGYAFLDMKLQARPGSSDTTTSSAAGSTPRHVVTVSSSWTLPRSFLANGCYRWVADRPTQHVPAYSELDLRVSRRVGAHLDLAVVGESLLHAHHAEFGGTVQIQRSIYGEAQWRW